MTIFVVNWNITTPDAHPLNRKDSRCTFPSLDMVVLVYLLDSREGKRAKVTRIENASDLRWSRRRFRRIQSSGSLIEAECGAHCYLLAAVLQLMNCSNI